jgi:hypothetical protein
MPDPLDGSRRTRGKYGTNEGDKWLAPGSAVQNALDADGLVLIHEMLVKDGVLQEVMYTTDNPEMIAEAREGHERWVEAQAREN